MEQTPSNESVMKEEECYGGGGGGWEPNGARLQTAWTLEKDHRLKNMWSLEIATQKPLTWDEPSKLQQKG